MSEQPVAAPDAGLVRRAVEAALEEDGARGDVTTQALVPTDQRGSATFLMKSDGVLCGLPVAAAVFAALDAAIRFEACTPDGTRVAPGDVVARVEGTLARILSGERVALNFLQRLSGVATMTRQVVDAIVGLDVRIVDTRKTTPGLRALERYAVRIGGGHNHRFNLSDAVLIKDNHLAAARARGLTLANAVAQARRAVSETMRIEVEVTSVDEARAAVEAGADVILLDNMPVEEMRRAVREIGGRAVIEASGGVALENVRAVAEAGVDIISLGALTHSAPALDISLDVIVAPP
ncbi:MAG: carboxylating nicotinate-nucleotide diphosphorylase [Dehalococcoidia bacterium]